MKQTLRILYFLLLALFALQPIAQAQSRRAVRGAEKDAQKALDAGYDFVIPPMERLPEEKPISAKRAAEMAAQTNWGRDLLLPATVLARIKAECKYPVVVKVTDTAPKIGHDYLKEGQLPGANYTGEAGTDDQNGHGTHCSGIIAGRELGLAYGLIEVGLLKFKPIKILSDAGSGSFSWVEQAYKTELDDDKALIAKGTSVIYSGSFGGGTSDIASVDAALKASTEAGVLFVFAAGNSGVEGVGYPGRSQYGIAVASLDQPLTRSSFSSTGPQVLVAEPGRSINSTYKGNTFALLSGTSMATPFGAALLAIAKSKWGPDKLRTTADARAYLARVCTDIAPTGRDNNTGYGLPYVLAVLDTDPGTGDPNPPPPPPPPPPTPVDPVFPARVLSIPCEGPYSFVWDVVGGSAAEAGTNTYLFGPLSTTITPQKSVKNSLTVSNQSINTAAFKPFTVQSILVAVNTTTDLPTTSALTLANVRTFYTSRGFGLNAPADGADALKWSAYFLEMIVQEQHPKPQVLRVLEIRGTGPAGEKIVLTDAQIPHWRKK